MDQTDLSNIEWSHLMVLIIREELIAQKMTYRDLANRLSSCGIPTKETDIKMKMSRGTFSAIFLIQCLVALDVKEIDLNRLIKKSNLIGSVDISHRQP